MIKVDRTHFKFSGALKKEPQSISSTRQLTSENHNIQGVPQEVCISGFRCVGMIFFVGGQNLRVFLNLAHATAMHV